MNMSNVNFNKLLKGINDSLQAAAITNKQAEILDTKIAEVNVMSTSLTTAEEKIVELTNNIKTLQKQVDTLKAENVELNTKVTDLQKTAEVITK